MNQVAMTYWNAQHYLRTKYKHMYNYFDLVNLKFIFIIIIILPSEC